MLVSIMESNGSEEFTTGIDCLEAPLATLI